MLLNDDKKQDIQMLRDIPKLNDNIKMAEEFLREVKE